MTSYSRIGVAEIFAAGLHCNVASNTDDLFSRHRIHYAKCPLNHPENVSFRLPGGGAFSPSGVHLQLPPFELIPQKLFLVLGVNLYSLLTPVLQLFLQRRSDSLPP